MDVVWSDMSKAVRPKLINILLTCNKRQGICILSVSLSSLSQHFYESICWHFSLAKIDRKCLSLKHVLNRQNWSCYSVTHAGLRCWSCLLTYPTTTTIYADIFYTLNIVFTLKTGDRCIILESSFKMYGIGHGKTRESNPTRVIFCSCDPWCIISQDELSACLLQFYDSLKLRISQ